METLILTAAQLSELVSMSEVIAAVEQAFKEKSLGGVQMPSKVYLYYSEYQGDLRVMPAYLHKMGISSVKIVNAHPNNPKLLPKPLPTVMAVIVLVDPATGFPYAILDGTLITALRTGAAGAIAAKYLARQDSKTVALIGAGMQARTQLLGLLQVMPELSQVYVWGREKEGIIKFIEAVQDFCIGRCELIASESPQQACRSADIIVTTTPSRMPIIFAKWVNPGTHINAIGADAPGKQELAPEILLRANKIVIDDWQQCCEAGEVNVPLRQGIIKRANIYGELGDIIIGKLNARETAEEITVFDSTGLAIQDAAAAQLFYKAAKEKKIGQAIELVKLT